ncbi:DMT family transporter [Caldivirga sp. UBA161]|uniref:DMT family transporter n=1 Tax=Caldivirga sp. UBA161 TaxID=1915569 RepID=UPI0025BED1F9|nr:DMT family transporter [Caldivirga sp. UBA161]
MRLSLKCSLFSAREMSRLSSGLIYSIALALVWGIAYPLTRLAEAYASPMVISVIRVGAASLLMYPLARRLIVNSKMLIVSVLNMGLFLVLINISILYSPNPGLAALMIYTQPLFVAIFEWLILKRRLSLTRIGGVLLGFVGVAVASLNSVSIGLGVIVGLMAGLLWGLGTILYSMWFRDVDSLVANASSSVLSIPVTALALPIDPTLSLTLKGALLILLVVLDAQILGFILWFKAIASERPSTVSSILLLTPILALYFSALIVKSSITVFEAVGTVVTIIGLLMVVRSS